MIYFRSFLFSFSVPRSSVELHHFDLISFGSLAFSFCFFGAPLARLTSVSFVDTHLLCINIRPFILAHILCVRTYCWRILLTTTVFEFVPLRFWNFCLGFLFLSLRFWNFCPGLYLFRSGTIHFINFCSGNPRLHFLATPQDLLSAFDLRLLINFVD